MACRAAMSLALSLLLALACSSGRVQCRMLKGAGSNGPCTPEQIHISLTGNPTEMRVTWKTAGGSCPSTVTAGPAAALAVTPPDAARLRSHRGSQHSYSPGDTCAAPARTFRYGETYLHTAVLTGLSPGRRHFYQIEGGEPVEFTAAVPTGPTHRFRFLVFGDMGESGHRAAKSPGAARTVEQLQQEVEEGGAELVLHVGDIAYANGREEIWDAFVESIEPFARHTPYMVATGNHEYDYERGRGLGGGDPDGDAAPEVGRAAAPDASGEEQPYNPDWGNYGNDSGGECGVQISRRFVMPDVAEHGYWTSRLSLAGSNSGNASSSAASGGGSDGGNPTLGPDAAARLAAALQQQQHGGPGRRLTARQPGAGGALHAGANMDEAGPETPPGAAPHSPRSNPPFWYSFSYGSVHFVVLSTEHNLAPGSKQYRWLEADLQLVDRCATPWVVLAAHRPLYVVYPHKSNRVVGDHLRRQLEPLLDRYQVDLVVSGHVHSYSRTCNVLDERCVPADRGGMTHITVGCAGHRLTDVAHGQEEWLEYAAVRHGFGRVTVNSGFSLLFELVGDDGVVHDSVKLHNSRANMRGCGYAPGEAAAVAAAASAAAGGAACTGYSAAGCTPSVLIAPTSAAAVQA